MRRPTLTLLLLFFSALTVAACGPVPKPFKLDSGDKAKAALTSAAFISGVRVLPLDEVSVEADIDAAEYIADALRNQGIVASTSPAMRNARLLKPTVFKNGDSSFVEWELFEPDGRVRESIVTALPTDRATAPLLLEQVIDTVRVSLTPANQATPIVRNAAFTIGQISGAPGDGNVSLNKAVRVLFTRAGLNLAIDQAEAGLILNADVTVDAFDQNLDNLKLVWSVSTTSGEEVGTLTQENTVPKGSLSEKWGPTAFDAVYALVESMRAVQTAYREGN